MLWKKLNSLKQIQGMLPIFCEVYGKQPLSHDQNGKKTRFLLQLQPAQDLPKMWVADEHPVGFGQYQNANIGTRLLR